MIAVVISAPLAALTIATLAGAWLILRRDDHHHHQAAHAALRGPATVTRLNAEDTRTVQWLGTLHDDGPVPFDRDAEAVATDRLLVRAINAGLDARVRSFAPRGHAQEVAEIRTLLDRAAAVLARGSAWHSLDDRTARAVLAAGWRRTAVRDRS